MVNPDAGRGSRHPDNWRELPAAIGTKRTRGHEEHGDSTSRARAGAERRLEDHPPARRHHPPRSPLTWPWWQWCVLAEMRKKAGLTQAEVAEIIGVSQQRVSAIENGAIAELATLADYIRALGGELKVIADFGDSWRRVA
jgi:DNA-binding XRE family transcriptional regulator